MITSIKHVIDNFLGRGDAAVTVPPLDGAFLPNRLLDEASNRILLKNVDCFAVTDNKLFASAEEKIWQMKPDGSWIEYSCYECSVACLVSLTDGLLVALTDGSILVHGGSKDGWKHDTGLNCITAVYVDEGVVWITNGSKYHSADEWQRDLLERRTSGSVWRLDMETGALKQLANRLAWPAGIVVDADNIVVTEAWKHRIVRIDMKGRIHTAQSDFPAYPGRISIGTSGFWLAMFAPRNQLVEFILREPSYRKQMMIEVPKEFWVSPKLRAGYSFYESLQGGGVKQLGTLKPWAPTMSTGICVHLDENLRATGSLQSRADGITHGITSAVEFGDHIYVAAKGDGVVVSVPRIEIEGVHQ